MTLPRTFSGLSLKRVATAALIPQDPRYSRADYRGLVAAPMVWTPSYCGFLGSVAGFQLESSVDERTMSRPRPRLALEMAAVNFMSMRLAEYHARRWVSDAPPLGHASRATLQRRDQEGGYACVVALATGKDRTNTRRRGRAHERVWR